MTSTSPILRTLLIYSICLPLAIFVGYLVASPDPTRDITTYLGVGAVLFLLVVPLLLRWHRVLLLVAWNSCALLYFLPSRPELWLALMWLSFLIGLLQSIISPRLKFISVPTLTRPLIFMVIVTLATGKLTGSLGLGAMGSDTMGGKKYIYILTAIIGYFALVSQPIPPRKAYLYVVLFFIGFLSFAINDIAVYLGPAASFLFWLFPLNVENVHVLRDEGKDTVSRLGGIGLAATGCFYAMLALYGIKDIFNPQRRFRLAFLCLLFIAGLFGGFRSILIHFALVFGILFYLEGLMRSRLLPALILMFILIGAVLVGVSNRLPMSIQRTLTILPLDLDPVARESAESSSKWRLDMWREVVPQIPHYLLLGKGYGLTTAQINIYTTGRPGDTLQTSSEGSAMAGDYHNGPLSLVMIFGIWGVIGFVWFLVAALKVLHQNYQLGDPELKRLNRFLFALFIAKTVFFFLVFGSFYSDLAFFVGIIALNVAINNGVAQPFLSTNPKAAMQSARVPIARRKPIGPAHSGV